MYIIFRTKKKEKNCEKNVYKEVIFKETKTVFYITYILYIYRYIHMYVCIIVDNTL